MVEIVYNRCKCPGLILEQYTKECYAYQEWDFDFCYQLDFLTWRVLFALGFMKMKEPKLIQLLP